MTRPTFPISPPSDEAMADDGPQVIPAATVVVFRDNPRPGAPPQLLLLERAATMRFAAGAAVFPGGRVDPADRALAAHLLPDMPIEMSAARIAAIRETLEETGLLVAGCAPLDPQAVREGRARLLETGALAPVLECMGWQLAPERLAFFAHWCPWQDKAFDTRFFLANLGTGQVEIAVDATENTRLFWASASEALAMAERGEIAVIFPTLRNLERLARFASHEEALADLARRAVRRIHPVIDKRADGPWLTIPDDQGYPVTAQPLATARRG
ncbi:NUDIX domain-containing protein [Novosphingobium sp. 1949]|uniref:NUDIX domain-containing protein n=1 Tax=Novosphingobium organovorum TaxID=2930092 RepID=A0ABT0BFJ9_9SPHN|nr:NUDIX domain-containing protein [Novosphingobium organovorum]MCJ2183804.1 NUDIX domain-containing protein [Novosphingobium organovorum]